MTNKANPFNPYDYMKTQDEMNTFLREYLEDDAPIFFVSALGHLVKAHGVTDVAGWPYFCHMVAKEKAPKQLYENIVDGLKVVTLTEKKINIGIKYMIESIKDNNYTF